MRQSNNSGFTLLEVLVATLLIIALGLALLGLQYIFTQSQVLVWKTAPNIDEANSVLKTLVRELRTSRFADDGAYPLVSTLDQEIVFYSDIDFDGQSEKVRYFLDKTTLSKGVIEPTENPVTYPPEQEQVVSLTDNVRNEIVPLFYYFNADWPEDTENNPLGPSDRLAETKLIYVYLKLNPEEDKPEDDFILESYVQIRMLKDNL